MPVGDFTSQINEARQNGYSDDDIIGHLSARPDLAPKIKEAQSNGYESKDILDHLTVTAPVTPPAPPGFWSSLGTTVTTNSPLNPMNWPGMVKSAFESPFSDPNMAEAHRQADLFTGKTKPVPIQSNEIPGMLGEATGQAVNAGLMYGAGKGLSAVPWTKVGAGVAAAAPDIAKGTAKVGAGLAIGKMVPGEIEKAAFGGPLAYQGGKQIIEGAGKGVQAFKDYATKSESLKNIKDRYGRPTGDLTDMENPPVVKNPVAPPPPIADAPADIPPPPTGNNINYPPEVHPQLHPAGPDVAITLGRNASAKDLTVAGRLRAMGITPEKLDAMPDSELNSHYTAEGFKPLGSDYKPGKRLGRDAETQRAHLRQVLSEAPPAAAPQQDLTDVLQQSLDQAKAAKVSKPQRGGTGAK